MNITSSMEVEKIEVDNGKTNQTEENTINDKSQIAFILPVGELQKYQLTKVSISNQRNQTITPETSSNKNYN